MTLLEMLRLEGLASFPFGTQCHSKSRESSTLPGSLALLQTGSFLLITFLQEGSATSFNESLASSCHPADDVSTYGFGFGVVFSTVGFGNFCRRVVCGFDLDLRLKRANASSFWIFFSSAIA